MMNNIKKLHKPPKLKNMIGPSIIMLGLGLGSGEIILWPYLVSNFGLGIIWAAIVGITLQFFINLEIERYSLIRGESVFVGFSRLSKYLPFWFIISTFLPWMWPGIIAVSAKTLSLLIGIENYEIVAIIMLVVIGFILTLGTKLYKTVETYQKYVVMISIPLIIIVSLSVAKFSDVNQLLKGVVGIGEGYRFIPRGIPLFTFLGALAYSGAGGNLNLAQSFYIKEKGYGLGKHAQGITSVLTGKSKKHKLTGYDMDFSDSDNYKNFKKWWRMVNLEHLIIFLIAGIIAILLLALLAYSSFKNINISNQGFEFLVNQAKLISFRSYPEISIIFLATVCVVMFSTQLTVLDSSSRIISENITILKNYNLSKVYYAVLWLQIIAGVIIFSYGYFDPISLVVIGAVLNALAMMIHVILTYILNLKSFPSKYRPKTLRTVILGISVIIFLVLGYLSIKNGIGELWM